MDKKIKTLRTFFTVSNIAFDCVMAMGAAFGGKPIVSPMHQLHKLALAEIEKKPLTCQSLISCWKKWKN